MFFLSSFPSLFFLFFFFNDTATTEIYTLSLHDALPILSPRVEPHHDLQAGEFTASQRAVATHLPLGTCGQKDRKSTRLNSSHANISYAVFCLKKKKKVD